MRTKCKLELIVLSIVMFLTIAPSFAIALTISGNRGTDIPTQSIDTDVIIPIVKAMQEQQEIIDSQKEEIQFQKEQINRLEKRLSRLEGFAYGR